MPQYQGVWTLEQQAQAQSNQQWVTDPNFKNTTLLLQADGTGSGSQNQTFLDGSTNNFFITRNGNTTQGSFSPFSQPSGYWSNYFNGGSTISAASNSALNILAYDTFECWVNMSVLGTNDLVAGRDGNYWLGYNHTSIGGVANKFVFSIWNGSAWQAVSSTTSPVVGTWYHIVGVKDNTTLRFYVNGVQESTSTFSGSPVTTGTFYVASNNNTENLEGYVSNLRLITGASNAVFPYSGLTTGASFTPPTSPLTAVSSTQLLTCQSNRFVDNSTNAFTLTTVSVPSVQAFAPFAPALQWTPDVVGGSGYFDGSSDSLTIAANANLAIGTSDFCIEWFYYQTSTQTSATPLCQWGGGANNWILQYNSSNFIFYYNNGSSSISFAYTPVPNQWTHGCVCRSGSTMSLYLNGVRVNTQSDAFSIANTTGITVGRNPDGGQDCTGYIAYPRLVVGSSVYNPSLTTLTVPTAPLTAVSGTKFLAGMTNAGIYDGKMANNLETVGNAQVSTSVVKYGSGSMYFDGTGDYLIFKTSPLYAFGTGDFTIEAWMNPTTLSSSTNSGLIGINSSGGYAWLVNVLSDKINVFTTGTTTNTFLTPVQTNVWQHLAITRANGLLRCFLNGTQAGSAIALTSNLTSVVPLSIGANQDGGPSQYFTGYIDDLRITNGVCRYIANFTPPQQALPRQ